MDAEKLVKQYQNEIFAAVSLFGFVILPMLKEPKEGQSRARKDRVLLLGILGAFLVRDAIDKGKRLKSYRECTKTDNSAICAARFIGQSVEV